MIPRALADQLAEIGLDSAEVPPPVARKPRLRSAAVADDGAAQARADRELAERIAQAVAKHHGRVWVAVFATNRDPKTVAARREVAAMLRGLGWSLPRIGRAMGMHHTSVMHMLRAVAGGRAEAA